MWLLPHPFANDVNGREKSVAEQKAGSDQFTGPAIEARFMKKYEWPVDMTREPHRQWQWQWHRQCSQCVCHTVWRPYSASHFDLWPDLPVTGQIYRWRISIKLWSRKTPHLKSRRGQFSHFLIQLQKWRCREDVLIIFFVVPGEIQKPIHKIYCF